MVTECRIALQTAQALIKGGTQGRVRVLFDSGRHRSFVTAKNQRLRKVVRFDIMPLLWRSCAGARSKLMSCRKSHA